MSLSNKATEYLHYPGVIEEPRDIALAAALIAGGIIGLAVIISPAIALYYIASEYGVSTTGSMWIGIGFYTLSLLYIRFGGININLN